MRRGGPRLILPLASERNDTRDCLHAKSDLLAKVVRFGIAQIYRSERKVTHCGRRFRGCVRRRIVTSRRGLAVLPTWTKNVMVEDNDPRESTRSNVFLAAVLASAIGSTPVRVRNLSLFGALIDGDLLPEEGSLVELHRGGLTARGEIAWRQARQCGLRFHEKISVRQWVQSVGHVGQHQVDRAIAALRQSGSGKVTDAHASDEMRQQMHLPAIADEINRICERLVSSPAFPLELGEDLVRLEALAQQIRLLNRSERKPEI